MSDTPVSDLHVCHITSVHPVYDTRILYRECISLAQNYKVSLIAPTNSNFTFNNVSIKSVPKVKNRLIRIIFVDFLVLLKAIRIKANIYHFHDPELIIVGLLLKLFKKKVIFDIHELIVEDLQLKQWLPLKNIFIFLYKLFENISCRNFHLILAERSYAEYYKHKAKSYTVIRNYPKIDLFKHYQKTNRDIPNIFYIGNLLGKRGLPTTIKALNILHNKGHRFNLHCIGSFDIKSIKYLEKIEGYYNVKDHIGFHGYMRIEEGIKISMDCFAGLALPEPIPNHERSYSTKIFEYMAVGLPVICSNFELYKDVVVNNNCGICINPLDPVELADAILFLFTNKEMAQVFSRNGIEAVSKYFNWEREEKKLLDIYHNLFNEDNNNQRI